MDVVGATRPPNSNNNSSVSSRGWWPVPIDDLMTSLRCVCVWSCMCVCDTQRRVMLSKRGGGRIAYDVRTVRENAPASIRS